MKKLFLLGMFFAFLSPVSANQLFILTSEEEPDVTVSMKYILGRGGGERTSEEYSAAIPPHTDHDHPEDDK